SPNTCAAADLDGQLPLSQTRANSSQDVATNESSRRCEMRLMIRLFACACVCLIAVNASAQSKFSGKCSQAKPDPNYTVPVGDKPDHAIVLGKAKCVWSSGEIAGIQLKEEDDTVVSDATGTASRDHGYGVGTASNGDKYFVRFEGTSVFKNNAPVS